MPKRKVEEEVEEEEESDYAFEDGDMVWVKYGKEGKYLAAVVFDLEEVPKEFRKELEKQLKKMSKGKTDNYRIVKSYYDDAYTTTHINKLRIFGEGGKINSFDKKRSKEDPKGFKLALKDFNENRVEEEEVDENNNDDKDDSKESKKKKKKEDDDDIDIIKDDESVKNDDLPLSSDLPLNKNSKSYKLVKSLLTTFIQENKRFGKKR